MKNCNLLKENQLQSEKKYKGDLKCYIDSYFNINYVFTVSALSQGGHTR